MENFDQLMAEMGNVSERETSKTKIIKSVKFISRSESKDNTLVIDKYVNDKATHTLVIIPDKDTNGELTAYIKTIRGGLVERLDTSNLKKFVGAGSGFSFISWQGVSPIWCSKIPTDKDEIEYWVTALKTEEVRWLVRTGIINLDPIIGQGRYNKWSVAKILGIYSNQSMNFALKIVLRHTPDERKKEVIDLFMQSNSYYGSSVFGFGWDNVKVINDFVARYGKEGLAELTDEFYKSPLKKWSWYKIEDILNSLNAPLGVIKEYMLYSAANQGYGNDFRDFLEDWNQYLYCSREMYKDFSKFPNNLASETKKVVSKYNEWKDIQNITNFETIMSKKAHMAKKYGDYTIVIPQTVADILTEAQEQSNCVASYVQQIADGETEVYFLRRSEQLEHSWVTFEVRDGVCIQAKRRFNAEASSQEKAVIDKWLNEVYNA